MNYRSKSNEIQFKIRQSTGHINTQKQKSARGPWSTTTTMCQLQTSTTKRVGGRVKTQRTRSKPRYNPPVQHTNCGERQYIAYKHTIHAVRNRNQKQKILRNKIPNIITSEAHPVDNLGTRLIILVLGDPHFLEGGERGQDGTSNPHRVLALRRGHHLDLDAGRRQRRHLFVQPLVQVRVHRAPARQHRVAVQVPADVHVALHDRLVRQLVDPVGFTTDQVRLEQDLSATEAFSTHSDHLSIGQLVVHLQVRRGIGFRHFLLKIDRHIAHPFLDVPHNLLLRGGGERVPSLRQDLHQILRHIAPGQVQPLNGVRQRIPFVDRHRVAHAISGVQHNSGGTARGVQRQHRLDRHVHRRHVEGFEHDLRHLLPVRLRVQRRLGQQHRVLLGLHAQLVVKRVVPDLLHVIPAVDNSVLDRIFQAQNASLRLRLVADVTVLLRHAHHHAPLARSAHNGRKDRSGSIITRKSSFHHSTAVVNDHVRHLFGIIIGGRHIKYEDWILLTVYRERVTKG